MGAAIACAAIDAGLGIWIQIGAPGHKSDLFFFELVILIAAALIVLSISVLAPEKARIAAPFLFIALAWHTGFQVELGSDKFELTVFDVLVPMTLFMAIVGGWFSTAAGVTWFQRHWRMMAVFWAFCLWGLLAAIIRGVDPGPMLANLKSLLFYPLILVLMPLCIKSWKQFYLASGLLLAAITERALDGLRQAATHANTTFLTRLGNGQLVQRIDGDMAATNQYATYLLTGFLIFVALVAASQLKTSRRILLTIPLGLIGLALLFTFSRGAWLGTAVALLALAFILQPRRGVAVLGTVLVLLLAMQVFYPQARTEFLARANDYDHSIVQREAYEAIGFQVVLHYPLGAGWGAWFERTPKRCARNSRLPLVSRRLPAARHGDWSAGTALHGCYSCLRTPHWIEGEPASPHSDPGRTYRRPDCGVPWYVGPDGHRPVSLACRHRPPYLDRGGPNRQRSHACRH